MIKLDAPIENIANLALDILEATRKAIRDPANRKPVKVLVSNLIKYHTSGPSMSRSQLAPAQPSLLCQADLCPNLICMENQSLRPPS